MRYLPQEIIRRKRDGAELDAGEIAFLIAGLTQGSVTEASVTPATKASMSARSSRWPSRFLRMISCGSIMPRSGECGRGRHSLRREAA